MHRYKLLTDIKIYLPKEAFHPTRGVLENLKVGDYVKIGVISTNRRREIFWCKVKSIGDSLKVEVNQELLLTQKHGLSAGSELLIQKKNIAGVMHGGF